MDPYNKAIVFVFPICKCKYSHHMNTAHVFSLHVYIRSMFTEIATPHDDFKQRNVALITIVVGLPRSVENYFSRLGKK